MFINSRWNAITSNSWYYIIYISFIIEATRHCSYSFKPEKSTIKNPPENSVITVDSLKLTGRIVLFAKNYVVVPVPDSLKLSQNKTFPIISFLSFGNTVIDINNELMSKQEVKVNDIITIVDNKNGSENENAIGIVKSCYDVLIVRYINTKSILLYYSFL